MFAFNWKNTETFRHHMEEMDTFRRSHELITPVALAGCPETAHTTLPVILTSTMPTVNGVNWAISQKTVVPIWYISMPRDSQN